MKKLFKNSLFLGAALLAFSCQESEITPNVETNSTVSFITSVGSSTKLNDLGFDNGDQMSVCAFTEDGSVYADYVLYTYTDGVLSYSGDAPIEFGGEDLRYLGVFPKYPSGSYESTKTWSTQEDQAGYMFEDQDLMLARADFTSSLTPTLVFYHQLSKLVLNVTADVDLTDADVKVKNVLNSVVIDYDAETVTLNPYASLIDITTYTESVGVRQAIVVPQTVEAGTEFIEITTAGGKTYQVVIEKDATMEAGKIYYYNITIENDEVEFSTLINSWDDGDLFEDPNDYSPIEDATFTLDEFYAVYENWVNGGGDASRILEDTWVFTDESVADVTLTQAILEFMETAEDGREISLEFPNLTATLASMFNKDSFVSTKFVSFSAPLLPNTLVTMFGNCNGLKTVSMPSITVLNQRTFNECPALEELTLCVNGLITSSSSNLFNTIELSNVNLYTGTEEVTGGVVSGTTWIVPAVSGTVTYSGFKSITVLGDEGGEGGETEDVFTSSIADLPTDGSTITQDTWVITDETIAPASASSPNATLQAALASAGRSISLEFPNLTSLESFVLFQCNNIYSVKAPVATSIGADALSYLTNMVNVELPAVTTAAQYAIYGATSLETVTLCTESAIVSVSYQIMTGSSTTTATLTVGSDEVTGAKTSNNIYWYPDNTGQPLVFKEIIFVESGETSDSQEFTLAEFANMLNADGISANTWVITDATISSMDGMYLAYVLESVTDREISLEFPNLTEIPADAIKPAMGDYLSAVVSISAPLVTNLSGGSAISSCPNLETLYLPSLVNAAYASIAYCNIENLTLSVYSMIETYNVNMFYSVTTDDTNLFIGASSTTGAMISGNSLVVFNGDSSTFMVEFKSITTI